MKKSVYQVLKMLQISVTLLSLNNPANSPTYEQTQRVVTRKINVVVYGNSSVPPSI